MADSSSSVTVVDSVSTTNDIVNSIQTITSQGAGKAYQSVAHASSISIQDGIDYLRNVSTIATAGIGVATAKLVATQDPQYADIITKLQSAVKDAADITKTIGMNAGNILTNFPSGK